MATTTRTGAIYGIGTYGTSRYGISNVAYVPDGVAATGAVGSVVVVAKANTSVVGLASTCVVGIVGVVGVAVTSVAGVVSTGLPFPAFLDL